MDWNHENEAVAVSASIDGTVCIWDISNASKLDSIVRPVSKAEFGSGGIYDIKWHKKHTNIFASTSTTGDLYL
jgi:WD40 repeat protein